MANNSTSVNLKYGDGCKIDDDCESKICEMTYKNGKADGRKCVKQALKYGKPCKTNLDCFSNRCVMTYGNDGLPKGKKCVVIKNLKRADTNFMGSATPKWLKDDKQSKRIKRNEDDCERIDPSYSRTQVCTVAQCFCFFEKKRYRNNLF